MRFAHCVTGHTCYVWCISKGETQMTAAEIQNMTPTQKISAQILIWKHNYMEATACTDGEAIVWAFDKVLGVGAYAALASELYDALRAKAAA
jgi:hypothetical protein